MTVELNNLDFIDLLGERHLLLRNKLRKMWESNIDLNVTISNSEWFIIAKTYTQGNPTVAQVTKQVDITRQAVHKAVKSLEAKQLIETTNSYNNKVKGLQLTPAGKEYYEKISLLKAELEELIAQNIGEKNIELLKKLFRSDWGIDE